MQDDDGDDLTAADIFLGLISTGKDKVVKTVLDDLVEPWYAARTGRQSSKTARQQVSDAIERALSSTLWVTRLDSLELSEDGTNDDFVAPVKFIVGRVFPQSTSNGQYTLRVVVFQQSLVANTHTLDLNTFFHDFVPFETLGFSDFNS